MPIEKSAEAKENEAFIQEMQFFIAEQGKKIADLEAKNKELVSKGIVLRSCILVNKQWLKLLTENKQDEARSLSIKLSIVEERILEETKDWKVQ